MKQHILIYKNKALCVLCTPCRRTRAGLLLHCRAVQRICSCPDQYQVLFQMVLLGWLRWVHAPSPPWLTSGLASASSPHTVSIHGRGTSSDTVFDCFLCALPQYFVDDCNQRLAAELDSREKELAGTRVPERVRMAVRMRLEMLIPYIGAPLSCPCFLAVPASQKLSNSHVVFTLDAALLQPLLASSDMLFVTGVAVQTPGRRPWASRHTLAMWRQLCGSALSWRTTYGTPAETHPQTTTGTPSAACWRQSTRPRSCICSPITHPATPTRGVPSTAGLPM